MEFLDSRRLTGPNLLWERPGAAVEVGFGCFADGEPMGPTAAGAERALEVWQQQARRTLDALGWNEHELIWRVHPTGLSLAFSAPIDALYSACEVADWIWRATAAVLEDSEEPDSGLQGLRRQIAAEQDPKLIRLQAAARAHGVNFCGDDEWTTIGMGCHGQTFDTPDLPDAAALDWSQVADIPLAMVTGTNGKSTTVRLMVEMVRAAGLVPGACSTDWIQVGDALLDRDDWSGPGGARAVMKDPRVEAAVLETARGGMLRRGLGLERADVAVITNVAADHLGEMGVYDLAALTEVKFIIERAADHLVLNADDPEVRRRGLQAAKPVSWYSLDPTDELIHNHRRAGGEVLLLEEQMLVRYQGDQRSELAVVDEVPMTLGGAVRYNVGNALAASGAALRMGLPLDAVAAGLRNFHSDAESNPGRLNVFDLGGVTAMVDFAHNPHGVAALFDAAARLPHQRLLVLLGQAGDRDDTSIQELARITAAAQPDRVIIKEMTRYLRGREAGEVAALLTGHLSDAGLPAERVDHAPSEMDAVRSALDWAQPGDLLLLLSHAEREAVLEMLGALVS